MCRALPVSAACSTLWREASLSWPLPLLNEACPRRVSYSLIPGEGACLGLHGEASWAERKKTEYYASIPEAERHAEGGEERRWRSNL